MIWDLAGKAKAVLLVGDHVMIAARVSCSYLVHASPSVALRTHPLPQQPGMLGVADAVIDIISVDHSPPKSRRDYSSMDDNTPCPGTRLVLNQGQQNG